MGFLPVAAFVYLCQTSDMKVFIIVAITADGYIARNSTELADWTSSVDKKLFVKLTKEAGVMVMGATTLATIGRALPGRRTIVYTLDPANITIEGVEPTSEDPKALIERLENEGVKAVAICGGRSIYTQFMQSGVVDELYLTVEPTFFGTGVSLFSQPLATQLQLLEHVALSPDVILLHYAVKRA
jgi:dihydrofolate reductase